MKFTTNSRTLLAHLSAASKLVENKPRLPILANFLLEINGDTLTVTASDGDNVVSTNMAVLDAECGIGRVCINARRFTELIKLIPNSPVTVTVDDATREVQISHTRGKYRVAGIGGGEYPLEVDQPSEGTPTTYQIESSAIINALGNVEFAAAINEARPVLNGINWRLGDSSLTLAATDTRVLAVYKCAAGGAAETREFNVPARVAAMLRAFLPSSQSVELTVYNNAVVFKGANYSLRILQLNGKFPDYNRVFPKETPLVANIGTDEIASAMSRLSTCVDAATSMLRMQFGMFGIHAEARDLGLGVAGEEDINCDYSGTPLTIGFNAQLLKRVFGAVKSPKIVMCMRDNSAPAVVYPSEQDKDGELRLLCMPVTLGD